MRIILWVLVFIGVAALCDDTRGATWLAFPGLLAGVCLLPRAKV